VGSPLRRPARSGCDVANGDVARSGRRDWLRDRRRHADHGLHRGDRRPYRHRGRTRPVPARVAPGAFPGRRLGLGDLGRQGYASEAFELGEHDAGRLAAATALVAGALWPHAQPSAAMLAAYRADPALAAMRIDFTATVREVLEVLIAGLLARH